MSVNIELKLFAQYRTGRFVVENREYPEGTIIDDILNELKIHEEKVPLGVLMVRGIHKNPDYVIQEGDVVAIFPKVGGG